MNITVNGKTKDIPQGTTCQQLIDQLQLKGPLALELNKKICPKAQHAHTILNNHDVLEIVTIVGGG
ncbi:MAG: sulfur carrier protein ThiS [Planctomycetes bacterium]|nr:sulfur carrier protein ThiS [Planctomycetota bacterium]